MKNSLLILLLAGVASQAADRPLGVLPDGRVYIKGEVDFCLKESAARSFSRADLMRQRVNITRMTTLHPAIANVKGDHASSRRWLDGEQLPAALNHRGATVPEIARSLNASLRSGFDAANVVEDLRRHPDVEWASLNFLHPVAYIPNDALWTNQWGPSRIIATNGWDVPQVTTTLRVAVIDTGVDLTHPDLAARIVYDKGFGGNPTGDAMRDVRGGPSIDHGTHVAGIVGAIRDNSLGIAGIANVGVMAMGCAVWDTGTMQYGVGSAAAAINDAVASGATVINCSFGMASPLDASVKSALDNAQNNGVIVVCAAGNETNDVYSSGSAGWAAHNWPIIVSNIQQDDTRRPSSNYGLAVTLGAPGTAIYSTITTNYQTANPNGTYTNMGGTSMAAPHVAAAAARVRSMNPGLIRGSGTRNPLIRMAEDLPPAGKDGDYGWGMLQLPATFLSTLKNAHAFVGYNLQPQNADGTYELAYPNISAALAVVPHGGTIVLNGGSSPPPPVTYPAQTITNAVTLTAFPDLPVTIGN